MNSTNALFVDLQGFKNDNNGFIVKELALATNEYTQIFLIKPPFPYRCLTSSEKKCVKWIENNLGYRWADGHIDFIQFKRIIVPYLENKLVFVKGLEKSKWIKDLCDICTVKNIEDIGCPSLMQLFKTYNSQFIDFSCVTHKTNYCALRNVLCIKKWFKNNQHPNV